MNVGATGVVVPLWSVHDVEAKTIALEFYAAVLAGTSPAEFIRAQRAAVDLDAVDRRVASRLAYQFFGHRRSRSAASGPPEIPVAES